MRNAIPEIMSQDRRHQKEKCDTRSARHGKTDCSTDDTATAAHPSLELVTEEVTGTPPLEGAPIGNVILRDCFVSLTYRGA